MPLTRHLYELAEVTSALQVCLRRGGTRALFWTWELVVSDETTLAYDTIRQAWLLWGGGHDPALLDIPCPSDAEDPAPWILLTERVAAAITAAGSLNAEKLLAKTATAPPPSPPTIAAYKPRVAGAFATAAHAELPDKQTATKIWNAIAVACTTKQRIAALWHLQVATDFLCADTLWTGLQMMAAVVIPLNKPLIAAVKHLRAAATPHPDSQLLHQTAAVFLIADPSLVTPSPSPSKKPSALALRDWATWTALVNNARAARVHAIPVEALHTDTPRGSMSAKYTNDADIHDPVALLPTACRWWRTQTASAGLHADPDTEAVTWADDESHEAFYARHFPPLIDIPDEWSLAERAKSHGRGVQEKAPPPPTVATLSEPIAEEDWLTALG